MSAVNKISKRYRKADKELRSKAAKFISDQSIGNVHDLRTSARRMESIVDLLPKIVRKRKKFKKYLSILRKFFRSTTEIRDLDVVRQNLESYSSLPQVSNAIQITLKERTHLISNALKHGELFLETKCPKIGKKDLSSKKLSKRRDKILKDLTAKLQEELPIVLDDYRKIRELHDMRKECKRLRYTLELLPSRNDSQLVARMRDWQSVLGAIRDIDVTEQFAEKKGLLEELEEVLASLRISRSRMLESFSKSAKLELTAVPTKQY